MKLLNIIIIIIILLLVVSGESRGCVYESEKKNRADTIFAICALQGQVISLVFLTSYIHVPNKC